MAFLDNIEVIREIEWGQKYLWDVQIEGAPKPFDKFFPATSIEEDMAVVEHFEFTRYMSTYAVPKNQKIRRLKLSFYDDEYNTLSLWLAGWINIEIFNSGFCLSPLEDVAKTITILKLNRKKEIQQSISYNVIPEGVVRYDGSSDSAPYEYSVDFIIVADNTSSKLETFYSTGVWT